jgi:transcription-repair coupling factor (superfamily II helicase)
VSPDGVRGADVAPVDAAARADVDDVLDPGVAVGPLAAVLRPARTAWDAVGVDEALVAPQVAHPFVAALLAERSHPLLVVTPRSADARAMTDALAAILGEHRVDIFPAWGTLPSERLSPQPATVGRRLAVVDRLAHPDASEEPLLVVVAPVRAALQPMDPRVAQRRPLELAPGPAPMEQVIAELVALGYERLPHVETRGQFAVRGGIVDVFPAAAEHAVRIEWFGDEIEGLRTFGVGDQRSIGSVDRVRIDPARELVADAELAALARAAAADSPAHADALVALAEGRSVEGAESLALALRGDATLLAGLMPEGAGLLLVDPLRCEERARTILAEAEGLTEITWQLGGGREAVGFARPDDLTAVVERRGGTVRRVGPFAGIADETLEVRAWDSLRGDVDALSGRVRALLAEGRRVVLSVDADGPARRIVDVLTGQGVPAEVLAELPTRPQPGRVEVVVSRLPAGFDAPSLGLALLATTDLFGPRRRRASRRLGTRMRAADAVVSLADGDAVVHRTHGVGIFRGMITRASEGLDGRKVHRDYVVVEYHGGDTLFVPSDQVDALTRYRGGDEPTVMRLGGAQWDRARSRARGAAAELAAELVRLYTARLHAPGHAFAPDGELQHELEDAFQHVETVDQLAVVEEIKRDMEAPLPMDRLLAGDVGFGKTEVAVRAAGKAVFDGKQVAVLVPTTILAQQHAETFRERFAGFPVRIGVASRFVPEAERRRALDGVAEGTIDIIIGTHALLAKSVSFHDLGLVIVDEEQRFGVAHKERLKHLRASVDVLSMSATPIPRTLEMAISGIRDLSVIETPPEDRQPVVTVVQQFDERQIELAIRRELLRDGQVFYVHNQVDTIADAAEGVTRLVPDARVGIAHGQMDERSLEQVMLRFWERELDVLVCTTIIESGLDVPNANTLIVERADLLGLGQMHQLRGRVGRSSERGYAYLLFPPDASMTEQAHQRLATVAEQTRLGSGLAIALRDLELRGAGTVLGADQSGQVAAIGFDAYSQLLKEELARLGGEPIPVETDIRVELPVDAHLPDDYVVDSDTRLDLYRRLAAVRDAEGVRGLEAELVDRFGPLPDAARRLTALAALKVLLGRWGIEEVLVARGDRLRVQPVELGEAAQVRLQRLHPGGEHRPASRLLTVPLPRPRPDDLVAWVTVTLGELLAPPKRRG